MDAEEAFLNARPPDKLNTWMRLRNINEVDDASEQTVRLNKSLYGIRETPKMWFEHFSTKVRTMIDSRKFIFLPSHAGSIFHLLRHILF